MCDHSKFHSYCCDSQVTCSDSANLKASSKQTISVTDIDEPPQDCRAVPSFVNETAPADSNVSKIFCVDPEGKTVNLELSKCGADPCPVSVRKPKFILD